MTIDIPEFATTEEKLLELSDALETVKNILGDLVDDMETDGKDVSTLEDALEYIDDAIDSIGDGVDELEEEESELDEEDEIDLTDGVGVSIIFGK